jgi:hypothetical protein
MSGRIRRRLVVLAVLGMLAALTAAGTVAQAAPVKELRVTVEPAVAADASVTDFTVTITNLATDNAQLGSVEIASPFTVNSVSGVTAPSGKSWTSEWPVTGLTDKVRLTANTLTDRLTPGQSVQVVVNATTPDLFGGINDADQVFDWLAAGRQANTFNDQMGGNDVNQAFANRQGTFLFRDGSGLLSTTLGTHQTLVRTGESADCSTQACTASDTQNQTKVTVTAAGCNSGTLVVDASSLNLVNGQIGAAAFYDYFDGLCPENTIATVDIAYSKSLVPNPGAISAFTATYVKSITHLDPNYVGDGNPLPSCDKKVTVNCVVFVKGGSNTVNAQIKTLLTDPGISAR